MSAADPAKQAILARVRGALRDVPAGDPGAEAVARGYRRSGALDADARAALFAERCADYRADVRRVAPAELPDAIAAALARRGARSLAAPADLPAAWRVAGVEWVDDGGDDAGALSHAAISAADGVVTACAVAIAETGVIVLDGGPAQGRRALTLLPDYHLCVVECERIVELVPEAVAALHPAAAEGRPMTWIAGPSATSDIEFDRVEGVHGPRTLDVLVVG